MPLEDADIENGCMHVWPGSHHREVVYPHGKHDDPRFDTALLADHGYDESQAVPVPMQAGDILFFHGHLLHRSFGNWPHCPSRLGAVKHP